MESVEDRVILGLLEELAMEGRDAVDERSPDAERRAYLEVIGLIPYGLGDAPSTERVKEQLMSEVRASEVERAAPVAAIAAQSELEGRPPARRPRWLLPLAASLLIALSAYSTWQHRELAGQRETIDSLAAELDDLESSGLNLAGMRDQLSMSRSRVVMATSRGAEICMLRPAGDDPPQPRAGGALVIAADRGRWYIRIHGLDPCPDGCSYRLWFITEGGVIPSVEFDMDPARADFEFSSTEVPQDLRAVSVTIEAVEGAEEPSGRQVLIADRAMRLL